MKPNYLALTTKNILNKVNSQEAFFNASIKSTINHPQMKKSSIHCAVLHIFVALFMLTGSSLMAQVTNTNTAATFTTLTAAINDPGTLAGHTLLLTASYSEGIVVVNKAITINGAGFTLTSTSGIYGIEVASPNVTISNITVFDAGTFGIQTNCGSDGLALTDVTVNSSGGTGLGINGSDNVVITNLTSTNNTGNGISITNCDNLSINGITTSGNAFSPGGFGAGIGLFTSNIYCLPAGINGFSLTGTVSIGENPKVYSQKATSSHIITGITGSSIMWAVGTSPSDRTYWPDKATAYFVVDALFEAPYFFPNTAVFVEEVATDNLYVDDNPNGDAVPPMLINTAIAVAQSGKTIFLEAGTFIEKVVVTKSLTIDGATMATSILDGTTVGSTGSGIAVNNGITNVTIRDLTVRNYALSGSNDAGIAALLSNNNFSVISCDVYNNGGGRGGVYVNGPVTNVLIDSVKAHDHPSGSRGIVVWNGLKSNITISNCEVYNNNCCGIELQDGTASGVNIYNNNVHDNADNGLGLSGMNDATGANLVRKNIVANNGRFGIEVKNPKGTGATSGTGSIVVDSNTVSFTATVGMNIRDHAGIAIFRRGFQSGNPDGYPNVPTGVIVQNNTVSGYTHLNPARIESEGFAVVVEGTNHKVLNNNITTSNIGVQEQGGAHPNSGYVANNAGDGNQSDNFSANYFGRGNAPMACGNIISGNTFSGNTTNQRTSTGSGSFGLVTNTNTGKLFCSIQAAIDDAQTLNGHIITVGAGTFNEQVLVNKEVTIKNATNVRPVINFTGTPALVSGAKTLFEVTAPNVTIDSLEFSVDVTNLGSAILASSATLNNLTVIDNSINPYRSAVGTVSFGLRNAISINVSPRVNSNNPTMLIQNNTITYNVGVDLTPGTADDAGFRSGVATDEGGGTITLNTITTISHDVLVRFGGNPAGMSITSNNFNGGGVELSDQNAACGPMVVSNNTFTGAGAPNTAVLRIKNNYDGITHTISSNTFTNHEWAISSENMKAVTFNANTFNTASPTAHALVINTKSISTNSAAIVQIAIAATITNNNFNGTGNAITFLNHDSDNDTYGTISMGTAGNENNFAATLSTFVVFDSQTGVSSGSVFPNYTATIGAGAGALTTMACWDVNLNAQNNKYDVGAGLQLPIAMSFAGRTTLETKLNHKPDNSCLGSLLYYLPVHNLNQNTYYLTIQEGVNAAVAGEVLECDAWTFNEHVIVDKSLTLQGVDSATCIITGTGFPAGSGTAGNGSGIVINNGITNVTIKKFKVQNFMGFNGNQDAGIYAIGGNNTLLVEDVTLLNNVGGSGFYANGPVNGVTINRVTSTGHTVGARGIVIWNGLKENITITNCNVFGNNCCGIELQDGTATGVIMTGNNVHDNGDNGLGLVGLGGPGSNLIQNNTVTNNGRFGIEVKNPNGSGTNSGAGSVVIDNNTVSRTVAIVDARDIAGIAVFRRSVGAGNVDVPYGAYVSNNNVSGYTQSSTSDGFGIVVEGINHTVATNTLNGNDVGIQRQAGHTPYPGDGNQNNIVDTYFGRGNAPYTCGVTLTGNILGNILANGINTRDVGSVNGVNIVTNTNTSETFCTIQQAIDDAQTVAGNTLSVPAGTYAEDIIVSKSLSILGPNAAINPCSGTRVAEAKIVPATADIVLREIMHVAASNVTISGFTIDGDNPLLTSGFTSTNGADIDAAEGVTVYETAINNLTVTNNIIQNLSYFGVTLYDYPAGLPSSGHVISNNKIRDLGTYDATSTIDYWGGGVLLYNNQYAAVTNNCMTNVRLGVQTGNFSQANPGLAASQFITGNSIQARRIGVFHNLHYSGASGYTLNLNTITGLANANESGVIGIELASLSVPSFSIDNNINLAGVTTNTTGYEIWNVKNTFPASISGGTVSNVNTGIFANNYEGYSSDAPDGAHAVVTDITITPNAAGTGVRVLDSPSSTLHANVVLNVTNSFITGGTDGVKFEGLSVNGPINNNSITGNSNKSINATAYTGGTAIDVTCNWYGSAVAGVVATEITGNVTYIPYLNNGTDNSAAQGFQPVPGSCLGITVTLTIAGTNVSCFGGNNGTATVTVVTGLAPYTYFWSNMQTTPTAINLIAGTYTVTVTDANGSTASASVTVTQPTEFTANCSVTNVSCFGLADGTAQVVAAGGTPPYTYLWNTLATTTSLSGLVAGSYNVTVTDANGCTATCIATVTQPGEILITCSKNSTPCAGGGTTANVCASATNGAGPFTYLWNTGATTPCLSDVAAGTYTVTVTNTANGCTRTKSITVN